MPAEDRNGTAASERSQLLSKAAELHRAGRLDEAEILYRSVLAAHPEDFDALHLLGVVEAQRNRTGAAVELLTRALAIRADAAAQSNLGAVLVAAGQLEAGLGSYDAALALKPDFADALNNRINLLFSLRRYADALDSCDRAVAMAPESADAWNRRGSALIQLKRYGEALTSIERALQIDPRHIEALNNRGTILIMGRRYADAVAVYRQLIAVAPDYPYARAAMFAAQRAVCDWLDYEATAQRIVADVRAGKPAEYPFNLLSYAGDQADHLQCARRYVADKYPPRKDALWRGELYRHDRIRIAYVCGDLRRHAIGYLTAGLFETHDRSAFELVYIALSAREDSPIARRIERCFDRIVDVAGLGGSDIARRIRELECDIAVDVAGYTANSRPEVFACRCAPVQVNYLAYAGTSGADYMDYFVADAYALPPEHQRFFSEAVVYLPDTYQANDDKRPIATREFTRADAGLPETGFVFCCFNNHHKITPQFFGIWMRLLAHVDGSVLWLMEQSADSTRNLRREAMARGIDPSRLVFAPGMANEEHLARHALADLFLDTLPYAAHTTASDALWAGLPVLTCTNETFAGRVAGSLLHAIGLPEMIAPDVHAYEALAQELAGAPAKLRAIRQKLHHNRPTSGLFDTQRYCRHLEAAYRQMYRRYQVGEAPGAFAVPADGGHAAPSS